MENCLLTFDENFKYLGLFGFELKQNINRCERKKFYKFLTKNSLNIFRKFDEFC